MKKTPFVNVDVKMSKKMLNALTMHEFYCIGHQIKSVTEQSVKEFLSDQYGADMAEVFKPEYLINSQAT